MNESLYENIPGGSRWRYVWGSTLVFVFVVQVITGTFLWMTYSPSTQTAWESVSLSAVSRGWRLATSRHPSLRGTDHDDPDAAARLTGDH